MTDIETDLVIIGGGPAGMIAGLLFARAGVKTLVLEKHGDFLRDFRGDTVHPSTLRIFDELGVLDELLKRPHNKVRQLSARIAGEKMKIVDFTHLPIRAPFIALMPQWEFLDFVAAEAKRYPDFSVRMECEATDLIEADGVVVGVRTKNGTTIRSRLTIVADGRDSRFRAGFDKKTIGAPMDVFWFRVPKAENIDNDSMGVFEPGRLFVLIDRGDYWQCAFVFAKGMADKIKADGIAAFCQRVREVGPETAAVDETITGWDDVKLLTVTVDRLEQWHRPGLLVIGDAAHAMSPIGGIGINLAVQDAVASANALAGSMAAGEDVDPLLDRIEKRRMLPTRLTQGMQEAIQNTIVAPLLASTEPMDEPPLATRLLNSVPLLRRLPARILGLGFRSEHVRSPDSGRRR